MSSQIAADPLPLNVDDAGTIYVSQSRVTLDVIIARYRQGEKPEEIALAFPSVSLADVYAVLGYYLRHTDEVDAYLQRRESEAAALRRDVEPLGPSDDSRRRINKRRGRAE